MVKLDEKTKATIEAAINAGEKVEITQTKTGILVFAVKRRKIAEFTKDKIAPGRE